MLNFIKAFAYKNTQSLRASIWHSKKFRIVKPVYRSIRFLILFIFNQQYRSDRITSFKYRRYVHQPNSCTLDDRYPELFYISQQYFKDKQNLKILSFGCSTGREVFALNEYLPQAHVVGVDINKFCLKECRLRNKSEHNLFLHSLSSEYISSENYDAIFCLAVLQHTNNRRDGALKAVLFTFNQFEAQIIQLDSKLRLGGLFFIDNCDFDFRDTKISDKYIPYEIEGSLIVKDRPLYDVNNMLVTKQPTLYRVFIKK